jgi:hypothetical protein
VEIAIAILVFAATGCATTPLVEHHAGCPADLSESPVSATFTLYSDCGRVVSTTSQAGDAVGFTKRDNQLLAINGPDEWPLKEANYRWVRETYQPPWFQSRSMTYVEQQKMVAEIARAIGTILNGARFK